MQGPEKLRGLLQVGSQCLSIGSSANACKAVLKESKGANFFQNDRLSPISPAHDMADGSFLFDPELACHSYFLSGKGFSLQEKSLNTRD